MALPGRRPRLIHVSRLMLEPPGIRLNLEYQREWAGKWYAVQQVTPIVEEEADRFVVVTVYTYYF
jgi:hypothetical protein